MNKTIITIFVAVALMATLTSSADADKTCEASNDGQNNINITSYINSADVIWEDSWRCINNEVLHPTHQEIWLDSDDTKITLNTDTTSYTFIGLQPDTEYQVFVKVYYRGHSNPTGDVVFITLPSSEITDDTVVEEEEKKSGSRCLGDCIPPTFGKLTSTGKQFVDVGFSFGDDSFVVDKYHVETPLITANVGAPYVIKAKLYESSGPVAHFGITFGVDPTAYSKGLAFIEFDKIPRKYFSDPLEYDITVLDNNNMINLISAVPGEEICNPDTLQICQTFTIRVVFNQKMEHEPLMIHAWDDRRNAVNNLINDGLVVSGKSLNPLPTFTVTDRWERDSHKTITIIDKTLKNLTIAVDESGIEWTLVNNFWQRDIPAPVTYKNDPNDRNSQAFKERIAYEQFKAVYILDWLTKTSRGY